MVNELFASLADLPQVEAIALGGSRAGDRYDESSDYDVYLYCKGEISEEVRRELLSRYCSYMEIGNRFWEQEDNCTLNNGVDMDLIYRDLDDFCNGVAWVVEGCQGGNGYTTCMWHNLNTCKIVYDRDGRLAAAKARFAVPYPKQLRENIIRRNMALLSDAMPAYRLQIQKAVKRGDLVSVNHRAAAFIESYFDIIFALNELTHPGEKRLIRLCKELCGILPRNFEENLNEFYGKLFSDGEGALECLERIIGELKTLLKEQNMA